jgi:hypothetical protein
MKTTNRRSKKTNKRTKKTNKNNKTNKKKIYRKNGNSHKLRKSITRVRGGDNGPLNSATVTNTSKTQAIMSKQIMIDAKKAVLSILKERADAEKIESRWQTEQGSNNNTNTIDLNINLSENQNDYDPLPFWGKLFTIGELKQIAEMLKAEVCNEVKKIAPAFEINKPGDFPEPVEELSTGVKVYNINNIIHYTRNIEDVAKLKASYDVDFPEKSKILCATLMIIGILTSKLLSSNSNYNILAKGGVAVSFALSNLTNGQIHVPINDLDFKIISANKSQDIQRNEGSVLATQICYLVAWLLKSVISSGYSVSVLAQSANPKQTGYSDIVKLSIKRADGKFIPILDMDFGNNEQNMEYFDYNFRLQGKMPNDMGLEVSYIYPSDRQMLIEKVYYYTLYFWMKTDLTDNRIIQGLRLNPDSLFRTPYGVITYNKTNNIITINHDGEILDVASCDRFLEKFKKSIILLVDGMTQTNQTSIQFETQYRATVNKDVFTNTLDRLLIVQIMNDSVEPKLTRLLEPKMVPKILPDMKVNIINSIYAREQGTIV